MVNTLRAVKIASTWMTVAYVVCFGGVALIPGVKPWFMQYALHSTNVGLGENLMTWGTFFSGLIIWVALAAAGAWLYAVIANCYKE